MHRVYVHLEPALCEPETLAGQTVVVIDVLRATTTLVYALAHGAACILPCATPEEARQRAAALPPGTALLGGERQGVRIDGFDLGNSPSEYRREVVAGKTIVFTTTNGTRALLHARQARRVLLAGFVNALAAVDALHVESGDVHILCAGTDRQVTLEDTLLAGFLAECWRELDHGPVYVRDFGNDAADLAWAAWRRAKDRIPKQRGRRANDNWLIPELAASQGGRNLAGLGLEADLADAAAIARFDVVPEFDPAAGAVRLPGG